MKKIKNMEIKIKLIIAGGDKNVLYKNIIIFY